MPSKINRKGKQSRRTQQVSALTPVPPLARGHRCRLVFNARVQLSDAGGPTTFYNFYRLNGPYDPDTAVLSQATPGLSAIAALYRSMKVWSAEVDFTGNLYGDSSYLVSLIPTAFQPVLPSNTDFWPVQRLAATAAPKPCCYEGNSSRFVSHVEVRKKFLMHEVANCTKSQYADEADYASTTASNPTRGLFCALAVTVVEQGSMTDYLTGFVRIAYDVEFYDPYPLQ